MSHWWGIAVSTGWTIDRLIILSTPFLSPPRSCDSTTYRLVYAFANGWACNQGYARNAQQPEPRDQARS